RTFRTKNAGKLKLAGGSSGVGHPSGAGIAAAVAGEQEHGIAGGSIEIRMIEKIEQLGAELQPLFGVDGEICLQRYVGIDNRGADDGIAPQVPQRARFGVPKGAWVKVEGGAAEFLSRRHARASGCDARGRIIVSSRRQVGPPW